MRSGKEQVRRKAALVSKAPDLREDERSMQVELGKGGGREVKHQCSLALHHLRTYICLAWLLGGSPLGSTLTSLISGVL